MSENSKRVTLGDHTYVLNKMGTKEGLVTLTRISKILGPAFGAAFKTLKSEDQITMGSLGAHGIGELIGQLAERISPDELSDLTDIFVKHTLLVKDDGKEIPLKSVYFTHFMGDFGSLFALLTEHINLNFASFFAGLGITAPRS